MILSYIIPCLNEEERLPRLIERLRMGMQAKDEIIVVDGDSQDNSVALCRELGVQVLKLSKANRAIQMNAGAKIAQGAILFFIHADTLPPISFRADIMEALQINAVGGCFRYQFDSNFLLLKFNSFCTRFSPIWCRGGDQGLFIKKATFQALDGFAEDHLIMEDYEFIRRLRQKHEFKIVPKDFVVSARKYELNSYIRVQWVNFLVFRAFLKGASQEKLIQTYRKWLILP